MYLGTQLFTDSEYEQRLTRVRERMDRQGLSAIIVTDPANIFYLCLLYTSPSPRDRG